MNNVCCFFKGGKCALICALIALGLSLVVMGLWNWLLPPLFGWRTITFLQAFGLLVLSKILFGGFRGRQAMPCRRGVWERWDKMTPEERERFCEGLSCCPCGSQQKQTDEHDKSKDQPTI